MRVALSFPGCHRRGGVERIVFECARYLAFRGHDTHVFSSDWEEMDPRVTRHWVPTGRVPALRMLSFAARSRQRMRKFPADVIGAFGVQSPPGGVLWVQSVHKAWLEISAKYRGLSGRLRQKLNPFHPTALALERHYIGGRRYRKLIAVSETVKSDLMRLYRTPAEDIVIIPNGFSPEEFNVARSGELREPVRRSLGLSDSNRVVVFAANEFERKGFEPLLRAVALLRDQDVRVLAVGRLNPTTYSGRIDELGLKGRVLFTGPTSDVPQYYAAGDVFVLPTQYEAWGLVIVEAMACGLPVVTSRLAGAAIAVHEGRSGYLLDDPRCAQEIAARLRLALDGKHAPRGWISDSVAEFAWAKVLVDYERVLLDCAAGPATA